MKRARLHVHIAGGLGNQLFQFATAYSLSRACGTDIRLNKLWYGGRQRGPLLDEHRRAFELHEFPAIRRMAPSSSPPSALFWKVAKRITSYFSCQGRPWISTEVGSNHPLQQLSRVRFLTGNLQDPRVFLKYRMDLHQMLTLEDQFEKELREMVDSARTQYSRIVAVHVRRGDNAVSQNLNPLPSLRYYEEAMSMLRAPRQQYWIFSDSPDWCRKQAVFKDAWIVEEKAATKVFRLMTLCDDYVLSPSTLGWWAAWLGTSQNKRIVAPQPYYPASNHAWGQLEQQSWLRVPCQFEYSVD